MRTDINSLTDEARVMIYPASRKLYPEEREEIKRALNDFQEGDPGNRFRYVIRYDRFIIVFIPEDTSVSAAQTNALVDLMHSFEKKFNISLIDKVKVFFKQGPYVQAKEVADFKKMIKNGSVGKKTIIFNNFIHFKAEYDCCWEVPATESWISHFFK